MNKAFGFGFLLLGSVLPATSWAGAPEDNRLLEAVRNTDHAAIKSALKDRANPNAPLPDNATVLSWAVDRQDAEGVNMLLAAGAATVLAACADTPPTLSNDWLWS